MIKKYLIPMKLQLVHIHLLVWPMLTRQSLNKFKTFSGLNISAASLQPSTDYACAAEPKG